MLHSFEECGSGCLFCLFCLFRHVLEHMPGHVLRHLPEYVLKYVPQHVLRHMLDKQVLEHVLNQMAHTVLMT